MCNQHDSSTDPSTVIDANYEAVPLRCTRVWRESGDRNTYEAALTSLPLSNGRRLTIHLQGLTVDEVQEIEVGSKYVARVELRPVGA